MKSIRVLVALSVCCLSNSIAFGEEAIISFVPEGSFNGSQHDQTVGWWFHLESPVKLTALGVFDHLQDGFNEPHEVGFWTSAGNLLADGILASGTSGTLVDSFRYVEVPPVTLPVGDYVVGAHFVGTFVDPFSDFNLSLVTNPLVAFHGRSGTLDGPGFHFPSTLWNDSNTSGFNFITSNFQFSLVPEPSAMFLVTLACIGFLLRRPIAVGDCVRTSS